MISARKSTQSLDFKILARIHGRGRGSVLVPGDFLDIGSREAVDIALHRLALKKTIRRLARGVYDFPKTHPVLGVLSPSADTVAKALAGRDRTRLQPAGVYAANVLGLSEQVPAKAVFLTDGPSRTVKIGPMTIQLRRTTPRNMAAAGRLSGLVIQAFRELGKDHITSARIEHLKRTLPADQRRTLLKDIKLAPAWMHPIFRSLAEEKEMKLSFLELPVEERRLYIEQAAPRRNVSPVVLEKDFWVCWLLGVLFNSEYADALVFKGGTSLSKVYGVIERFSEDIDLSLSPEFLQLPSAGTSRTQANKWMTKAEAACAAAVQKQIAPALETAVESVLGKRDAGWFEFVTDPTTNSPVLLFHYPSIQPSGFDYLKRSVKLEFGSLTDQQPIGRHPVRPWLAEVLPVAFPDWRCEVVALEVERSFWEKATILHTEYHRPAGKPTPDRFSRHYADTATLARHPAAMGAIERHDLRERVVAWKAQFFGSSWANYDLARPGTFRLVPTSERQAVLRRDYVAMRDMYLSEPVPFENILAILANLESQINNTPKSLTS